MGAKRPRKHRRPPDTPAARLRRTLLVGAAIGAYFGYFFRPVREGVSLEFVRFDLLLSLVAAVAATLVLAWQIRRQAGPKLRRLLRYGLRMWVTFALFLLMLEGRYIAYNLGGRLATVAFTTLAGMGLAIWYVYSAGKERP